MAAPCPFGIYLDTHFRRLGISQSEFSRRIGKPPGVVQFIREGKRTPPLEQMPVWADVLGLTGEKRAEFMELAWAQHAPKELVDLVARLRKRIAMLEARLAKDEAPARRVASRKSGYRVN